MQQTRRSFWSVNERELQGCLDWAGDGAAMTLVVAASQYIATVRSVIIGKLGCKKDLQWRWVLDCSISHIWISAQLSAPVACEPRLLPLSRPSTALPTPRSAPQLDFGRWVVRAERGPLRPVTVVEILPLRHLFGVQADRCPDKSFWPKPPLPKHSIPSWQASSCCSCNPAIELHSHPSKHCQIYFQRPLPCRPQPICHLSRIPRVSSSALRCRTNHSTRLPRRELANWRRYSTSFSSLIAFG